MIARSALAAAVIARARARRARRRRRLAVCGALAALAALAALPAGSGGPRVAAGRHGSAAPARRLAAGRAVTGFALRERAGVVLLAQVSAPRGVRVAITATLPGVARVAFGTVGGGGGGRNPSCVARAGRSICTEAVEWCPMPSARWWVRIVKSAGPAGTVRVRFVVGAPPRAGPAALQ